MFETGPPLLSYEDAGRACGGLSESTLRRLVKEKRFPKPIVVSRTKSGRPARVAFVASEVHQAVADMIATARAPRPAEASALEAEGARQEPTTLVQVVVPPSPVQRARSGSGRRRTLNG